MYPYGVPNNFSTPQSLFNPPWMFPGFTNNEMFAPSTHVDSNF